MSNEIVWSPPEEIVKSSKLTKFIKFCKLSDYDELEKKSYADPGWLWENVIKFSEIDALLYQVKQSAQLQALCEVCISGLR